MGIFFKDGQSLNLSNLSTELTTRSHESNTGECGCDWSEMLFVNTAVLFFAITWCFLLKMKREYVDFRMQRSELLTKAAWQIFEIIVQ